MTAFLNALSRALATIAAVPAARTATFTSAAIDLSGYDGELGMLINSARASAGTTPTLIFTITHCDTSGGSYVDSGLAAFTTITDAADSLQLKLFQKSAVKQYIKLVGTIAGASASFNFGASVVGLKRSLS